MHTTADYLALLHNGLPKAQMPKRIIVLGAGMAGLVAAELLARAGHDPVVLEAQQRVGGRVYTLRAPFAPGLYAEAGAMRIPTAHTLTMALIERERLTVQPFTVSNPQAWCHIRGRKLRWAELQRGANLRHDGDDHRAWGGVLDQWAETLKPILALFAARGEDAWDEITARYDRFSTRTFLDEHGWSDADIERLGLLADMEVFMQTAFLEVLREEVGDLYTAVVRVDGGLDQLPQALFARMRERVRFGTRVVALDQSPEGVTVHIRMARGLEQVSGDAAIVTLPYPTLRHVDVLAPFSPEKQRAIREVPYEASAKIFLQFRERFWEQADGIFGGLSVTDLPIRNIYYPEAGRETGRGVLLASYTKVDDARRWGMLPLEQQSERALANVAQLHPQAPGLFEAGAAKIWHNDEFAGGAAALFAPGQQTRLHHHIVAPEGRFFFAGEHTTLNHGWIQGAVESGLRAAAEASGIRTNL